jgi:lysophospholipase L1-like esterase
MNEFHASRRNFIKKAGLGSALTLGLPSMIASATAGIKGDKISLAKDDVILFQGDSITDAGRIRDETAANNTKAFGSGYALFAASQLLLDHPDKNLTLFNKGISGNKVYQLAERWDADCVSLKPTVLSILIGVNDFWHMLNGKYDGTIDTYRNDFQALLKRTKEQLPGVKLIIGEPFAVSGIKAVDDKWFPAFLQYQQAVREIAESVGAVFIPYQEIFNKAQKLAPGAYWTHDGVHPSIAGNQLMAHAWLKTIKA